MPKVSARTIVHEAEDRYLYTIRPFGGGIFSPGERITIQNAVSTVDLTEEGIEKWQEMLKIGIASDSLRDIGVGSNEFSSNGVYKTNESHSSFLPEGTNVVGILEVYNYEEKTFLRYSTVNSGKVEIYVGCIEARYYWTGWTNVNSEGSISAGSGIYQDGSVFKLGGNPLSEDVEIDLNGHTFTFSGEDAELIMEMLNSGTGITSSFSFGSGINVSVGEVYVSIGSTGIEIYQVPKFINRNTLPSNNAENAVGNTVYITDASTTNLPDTTKVGILEAFDHNESGDVELRYTTYTGGVMEIWGRKKSSGSWYNWNRIEETPSTILDKIGNGSTIDSQYLPSYVDDIIEGELIDSTTFNDTEGDPVTPSSGKIYVDIVADGSPQYRWTGTVFTSTDNPLDYTTQPEAETDNPTENTKVATILRVFQGFVHWVGNVTFSTFNTTSKTIKGAINELADKTKNGYDVKTLAQLDSLISSAQQGIWVISADIDLNGGTKEIPSDVILDFRDCAFSNGNIVLNETKILNPSFDHSSIRIKGNMYNADGNQINPIFYHVKRSNFPIRHNIWYSASTGYTLDECYEKLKLLGFNEFQCNFGMSLVTYDPHISIASNSSIAGTQNIIDYLTGVNYDIRSFKMHTTEDSLDTDFQDAKEQFIRDIIGSGIFPNLESVFLLNENEDAYSDDSTMDYIAEICSDLKTTYANIDFSVTFSSISDLHTSDLLPLDKLALYDINIFSANIYPYMCSNNQVDGDVFIDRLNQQIENMYKAFTYTSEKRGMALSNIYVTEFGGGDNSNGGYAGGEGGTGVYTKNTIDYHRYVLQNFEKYYKAVYMWRCFLWSDETIEEGIKLFKSLKI